MHDGYIFTIGICGSTGGLAPTCLDAMLAALPPVKRAALLGEVLLSEGAPDLHDPLVEPIRADIADAELLLIVTPVLGTALPTRLYELARRVIITPPPTRPRHALLVILGQCDEAALTPLRHLCAAAEARIVSELWVKDEDTLSDEQRKQLEYLTRAAYEIARGLVPEALPQ
ncbi:MAG: hypothetical protein HGA65_13995 [Oscillochloris sp.]|nr:hypothetical protein [Oscillochloris sp.]